MPRAATDPADDDWARRVTHAIAAGRRDALAELFERRFDGLVALVSARTRRDCDFALDCVQDAFVRVAERLPPLAGAAALDAWLARAALRAAVDRLRAEAARARRERAAGVPAHAPAPAPSDLHALDDELAALDAALDDEQRALLRLRHAMGLTVRQIARHLGLGEDAVESRLRRALRAARDAAAPRSPERTP
jgi:RNA polymerase sigma factor (sigma-70 family)